MPTLKLARYIRTITQKKKKNPKQENKPISQGFYQVWLIIDLQSLITKLMTFY